MKTITINPFDVSSIENAIADLKAYKKSLNEKCMKLIEAMCKEGEAYARARFAGHLWTGHLQETIMGYRKGNIGIISVGGDALWVEFGTGVAGGGYVGENMPASIPATLSDGTSVSYPGGLGRGSDPNGWTYYDKEFDRYVHTKGHPSDPFMWKTARFLEENVSEYARKAFNEV